MKLNEFKEQLIGTGRFLLYTDEAKFKVSKKYEFTCSNNHRVIQRADNVLRKAKLLSRSSKGCPQCRDLERSQQSLSKTTEHLPQGFEIIDSFRKQVNRKEIRTIKVYKIKCNQNHEFYKESGRFKDLTCTVCSKKVNIGQERTRKIFETIFKVSFNATQPDWLKNPKTNRNLELDGYNEELNIAFEFQGRQHTSSDTQFREDYEMQIERDKLKRQLCQKKGIKLIEIHQPPSYKAIKFVDDVLKQIKDNINVEDYPNVHLNVNISDFNFKDITFIQTPLNVKLFQNYLKNESPINGYSCITHTFHTYEDNILMCCPEGHEYETTAAEFKRNAEGKKGRNIPCTICYATENKVNTLIDIDFCREEGKKHGLELLSTEYNNVSQALEWKDSNGDIIQLEFRKLQRRKLVKKSNTKGIDIEYCREKGKEFGLELLSTEYINVNEKLLWKDSNGETVELYLRQLQRSKKNDPKPKTGITTEFCREEGEKYGLELLSTEYKNVNEKLLWKKTDGSQVELSLRQIQRSKTGKF